MIHDIHARTGEQTEGAKKIWQKRRVDRMLVDHLLRSGFYTAAQRLAKSSGLEVSLSVSFVTTNSLKLC